jgi:hypothetical protein
MFDTEDERKEFRTAVKKVQEFLAERFGSTRTLALFANASGILMSRDLDTEVTTEARWGFPHVEPYLAVFDECERYAIVITDKRHPRLLVAHLGRIETAFDIEGMVQNTDVNQRLETIIRQVEKMFTRSLADRLILAGSLDDITQLYRLLPEALRTKVAGTMPLSVDSTVEQIANSAFLAEVSAEKLNERQTVGCLELAAPQGQAVLGIHDTLRALRWGKAAGIVYAEIRNLQDSECDTCKTLLAHDALGRCGLCEKAVLSPGLLDLVLTKALLAGIRIEQVRGTAADRLRKLGGIGAFVHTNMSEQ